MDRGTRRNKDETEKAARGKRSRSASLVSDQTAAGGRRPRAGDLGACSRYGESDRCDQSTRCAWKSTSWFGRSGACTEKIEVANQYQWFKRRGLQVLESLEGAASGTNKKDKKNDTIKEEDMRDFIDAMVSKLNYMTMRAQDLNLQAAPHVRQQQITKEKLTDFEPSKSTSAQSLSEDTTTRRKERAKRKADCLRQQKHSEKALHTLWTRWITYVSDEVASVWLMDGLVWLASKLDDVLTTMEKKKKDEYTYTHVRPLIMAMAATLRATQQLHDTISRNTTSPPLLHTTKYGSSHFHKPTATAKTAHMLWNQWGR